MIITKVFIIFIYYIYLLRKRSHVSTIFHPVFFDRVSFIRLLIGPSSSIRLLIGREFHHFHNRRLSHRAITVCHFISDYNAVRRLPVFWSTTVQRDVLFDAFSVHAHVVLTRTPLPSEASTQTRFPTRRWSTSKLTDHR